MLCKICQSSAAPFAKALVLGKYDIQYFSCGNCGFIQTESPYWLGEAYADSIARSDIGLVGRNIKTSKVAAVVIACFFRGDGPFLDYGGGNGMFVRLMRDIGFDFYWCDKYTTNQFAVGFEAAADTPFALATAFEVFEHMPDPMAGVEEILSFSNSILFSTTLVPEARPLPQEWWYYALDTGQHISLYTKRSLVELAKRARLHFYTNGLSIHLLTKARINKPAFGLLTLPPVAALLAPLLSLGRRSLLEDDYFRTTGKRLR